MSATCSLLTEMFEAVAARQPETPAVLSPERTLTYAQLRREAQAAGAALARQTSRETVALFLPMCSGFASAFLGTLYAGKAALALNLMLPGPELAFILQDAGADVIVTLPELKAKLTGLPARVISLDELLAPPADALPPAPLPRAPQSGDVAALIYTSGTTGKPKGVELTHGNLVSNALNSVKVMNLAAGDRIIACLPTFHTYAITATFWAPLACGGALATLPRFEPEQVLQTLAQQRCNVLIMVPSMYRLLIRRQERSAVPLAPLKVAISGGEPLAAETREKFEKVFGLPLLEGYGQTETSPIIAFNRPEAHRAGTVGQPLPGYRVKIVDTESFAELPTGQQGEIWTQGPHVMRGYRNRPEETAKVLRPDGWLRTGDVGCLDAEGFLKITGRLREIIKVGGEMVFPAEVENVLLKHPAVFEAGVIGVPDERYGESVKAFVALHPNQTVAAQDLIEHCRKLLPLFKVPRTVEFRPELPKGFTGKVLRRMLK